MANKIDVAEQVAKMTQEEQDRLLKVGKRALIVELIVGIPWTLMTFFGLYLMYHPPLTFDYRDYDRLFIGYTIFVALGMIFFGGLLLFVKLKFPFYSDAKYRYITKQRKAQK